MPTSRVDERPEALRGAPARNEPLVEVLSRAAGLGLPAWYLTFPAVVCCVGVRLDRDRWPELTVLPWPELHRPPTKPG